MFLKFVCYTVYFLFTSFSEIRKLPVPDLLNLVWHSAAKKHNMCHAVSCFFANMLCSPLPRHRPLTTGKGHFACSVGLVHFRKDVIREKVGSNRNGHPVI